MVRVLSPTAWRWEDAPGPLALAPSLIFSPLQSVAARLPVAEERCHGGEAEGATRAFLRLPLLKSTTRLFPAEFIHHAPIETSSIWRLWLGAVRSLIDRRWWCECDFDWSWRPERHYKRTSPFTDVNCGRSLYILSVLFLLLMSCSW